MLNLPLKTVKGPPKGASSITHSLVPIALLKHHQQHTLRNSGAKISQISDTSSFFLGFLIIRGLI